MSMETHNFCIKTPRFVHRLDAHATHISLTPEGLSVDLQVFSFVAHEALNQPFCFGIPT